jgi:hypothetical protein
MTQQAEKRGVDALTRDEVEIYLAGSCNTADEAAEIFGLDEDQVAAIMSECGHERCEGCGWWCEDGEIDIVDDEYICADCLDP